MSLSRILVGSVILIAAAGTLGRESQSTLPTCDDSNVKLTLEVLITKYLLASPAERTAAPAAIIWSNSPPIAEKKIALSERSYAGIEAIRMLSSSARHRFCRANIDQLDYPVINGSLGVHQLPLITADRRHIFAKYRVDVADGSNAKFRVSLSEQPQIEQDGAINRQAVHRSQIAALPVGTPSYPRADQPGGSWIKLSEVADDLHGMGFTDIEKTEADDGLWKVHAVRNGSFYKVELNPYNGHVVKVERKHEDEDYSYGDDRTYEED
jgi:hypothetical protein